MMKTIMVALAILGTFYIQGCGDLDTSDTRYSSMTDNTVNVGDNSIYTIVDSEGRVTIEYAGTEVPVDENGTETVTVGEWPGAEADEDTCNAAGFFWCSIQQACTQTPLDDNGGGSCQR